MGQAQLQPKSKSLAPPDTGSGLCPQRELAGQARALTLTVERTCPLGLLQAFAGTGMAGSVEPDPVQSRFAIPKPVSGTPPSPSWLQALGADLAT